jgi:hypothetical protein
MTSTDSVNLEITDKLEQTSVTESASTQKTYDLIFTLLKENKLDEATEYVNSGRLVTVDCEDEHGTTPLQYAAFRGFYDLCELLMAKGADVNAKTHDQGYSALMFAAIASHRDVVGLLLDHEADVDYKNTIGRTASQMASFVNSQECVDLINGHIARSALLYFTEINSISETEPKLPKGPCCDELYRLLVNTSNYSPVRALKLIRHAPHNILMRNIDRVRKTLTAFVRRAFREEDTDCPNDVLAFKIHFFHFIFDYLAEQRQALVTKLESANKADEDANAIDTKLIDLCLKSLTHEEEVGLVSKHGGRVERKMYRVFAEKFLRECIRQFPYKECALLRQMVAILAKQEIGSTTNAQFVITSCLNGQRMAESHDELNRPVLQCETCTLKSVEAKWCTHCKQVAYCDQFCQRVHWPIHKNQKLTAAAEEEEAKK